MRSDNATFKKITKAMNFFEHLQIPSFYLNKQSTERKFEIQFCLIFFEAPKMGKIGFAQGLGKTFF